MRPTRSNSSEPPRRPTASKDTSVPRSAETKNAREPEAPPVVVVARPQPNGGVMVIRRKGKVGPPVTESLRGQTSVARPGVRKFRAKKVTPPPPPPPPRALYRIIMEKWPSMFPARPDEVRPLAIGIHELLEKRFPDRSPEQVRRAIAQWRYPRLGAYLRVVARGGARYDLDGNPSGEVTESEQENARQRLQEWRAQRKAQAEAAKALPAVVDEVSEVVVLPQIADDR